MFFKAIFSKILSDINASYPSMSEFSKRANFDRTYISKYINQKYVNPPTPRILEKIADASHGITSYEELMRICGYFERICADRLKGCRLKANLSITEVAKEVNIQPESLRKFEEGENYNIDFETLNKLCKLYNVDISWIIGLKVPEDPPTHILINTKELSKEDIEDIYNFIEFVKNKKKTK